MLAVAIVVSAIVGAAAGFGAGSVLRPKHANETREFWVYTIVLPFNETQVGRSHDYFAPDRITVFQGDTVKVNFYNTEDEPENHTFTMTSPYGAVNKELPFNKTTTFSFTANVAGIFPYRCTIHQPTMTGWLVVLDN